MKRYVAYIFAVLSLAWMVSCSVDEGLTNPNEAGRVALQFQSSSMTRSAGDDALNENKLVSLDCYFYPTNGTGNDAKWHYRVELKDGAERLDTQTPGVYTIENELMPNGEMSNVFGSGANGSGVLYVIANYPNDDLPNAENLTGSSIDDLKQKVVTTVWSQGANWQAQSSFVMDGQATVNKRGTSIEGTVQLIRSAAKIELAISSVEASAKNGDKVYVPALGENGEKIGLTMHQAATKSQIANDWKNSALTYNADANSHISLAGYTFKKGTGTAYTQVNPFYSYPTHWGAGPSGEAYLLLVVPWQEVETNDDGSITTDANGAAIPKQGTKPQSCYYEIPIGKLSDGNVISEHIERNRHYQISINIGTLGSFVEEEPVILEPSYMVVDWTNGDIEAQIKDQRYLVVDQHSYTMENTTTLNIPFVTSHECEIVEYDCTQEFLFDSDKNPTEDPDFDENADGTTNRKYSINIIGNNIVVKHGLNNDLYDSTGPDVGNGVFDFTPYTITFTIRHKDATTTFKQAITITQNPAMYGTANINSDYNNDGENNKNDDNGFVWVNGYQKSPNSNVTNFCAANGLSGDGLNANSMYTITTTALDANSKYVIGDPRTTTVDNLSTWNGNSIIWASAPALTGEDSRTLKYYYPTDANNDGEASHTYNMIAPKFRVSSAYGAISSSTSNRRYYENVEGRCASYQEDGYPAGRWRLPTAAEFEIINTLTNKGLLPTLFVTSMDYWCAHGYGHYDEDDNKVNITPNDWDYGSGDRISVRCVYDEWYWGSEPALKTEAEKDQFTWGDMPRNN